MIYDVRMILEGTKTMILFWSLELFYYCITNRTTFKNVMNNYDTLNVCRETAPLPYFRNHLYAETVEKTNNIWNNTNSIGSAGHIYRILSRY